MNLTCLKEKLIALNEEGIPLPLIRDNVQDRGSFTLTMFFLSFNVCLLSLIGKISGYLGGVNFNDTLWLLSITGGFYLGRSISGNGKNISVSGEEIKEESK